MDLRIEMNKSKNRGFAMKTNEKKRFEDLQSKPLVKIVGLKLVFVTTRQMRNLLILEIKSISCEAKPFSAILFIH